MPQCNDQSPAGAEYCRELALANSTSSRQLEEGVVRRGGLLLLELRDGAEAQCVACAVDVDPWRVLSPIECAEKSPHLRRMPTRSEEDGE